MRGDIREPKHATFLSHRPTPGVCCFPILLVFTLPHLYFKSLCTRDDYFENLGETNVLACKMFTSSCRPWLQNIACLSSQLLLLYVCGYIVMVQTDHKPLVSTWKKSIVGNFNIASSGAKILRLSLYDQNIKCLKGKDSVVSDAPSRVSPLLVSKEEKDLFPCAHAKSLPTQCKLQTSDVQRQTTLLVY